MSKTQVKATYSQIYLSGVTDDRGMFIYTPLPLKNCMQWQSLSNNVDELQSVNLQKPATHLSIYKQISPTQSLHQLPKCLHKVIDKDIMTNNGKR